MCLVFEKSIPEGAISVFELVTATYAAMVSICAMIGTAIPELPYKVDKSLLQTAARSLEPNDFLQGFTAS